jgi:molybdopterin synthase catalytic subunit
VTRLEYQAYSKLAIKTMLNIVQNAQQSANRAGGKLIHCALYHRLGDVPVGDPSIGGFYLGMCFQMVDDYQHSDCSFICAS